MNRGRLNWGFAEMCDRAQSLDELEEIFLDEIRRLGFIYAACASHVDPLRPPEGAVMILDYPRAWVEHFSQEGLARRDPVYLTARVQSAPFWWSDKKFRRGLAPDQIAILNEAAEAGLRDGFTIPLHAHDALPASCSLILGPDDIDPLAPAQAQWCATFTHEAARRLLVKMRPPRKRTLTTREREVVEYVARGKTDIEIGIILNLSHHTVHNVVRRVMQKMGVINRTQMFARVLRQREIMLEDVT